jgi:hypothetical protein
MENLNEEVHKAYEVIKIWNHPVSYRYWGIG